MLRQAAGSLHSGDTIIVIPHFANAVLFMVNLDGQKGVLNCVVRLVIVKKLEMAGASICCRRPDSIMRAIVRWSIFAVLTAVILAGCTGGRKTPSAPPTTTELSKQDQKTKDPGNSTKPDVKAKGNEADSNEPAEITFGQKGAFKRVSLAWQEDGQPKLVASADELTGNTLSGTAEMKRVTAQFFDGRKHVATLTAPLVRADEKSRIITATGGVTVTSNVAESTIKTVKADWVKWYSREDKLVGNGGIQVRGPVTTIDATAFVADTQLRTIKITADPDEAKAIVQKQEGH